VKSTVSILHLPPSSDSCGADKSSSSTCALRGRFLQSAMTLGLKNVGHFARNLPDTSSPMSIVKSWSILNTKQHWKKTKHMSKQMQQPQRCQQYIWCLTKPDVSRNLGISRVPHHRHSFFAFITWQLPHSWTHVALSLRAVLRSGLGFLDLLSRVALHSFQPPCQVSGTTLVIIEMFLLIKRKKGSSMLSTAPWEKTAA